MDSSLAAAEEEAADAAAVGEAAEAAVDAGKSVEKLQNRDEGTLFSKEDHSKRVAF
jgi:hypothetical protein